MFDPVWILTWVVHIKILILWYTRNIYVEKTQLQYTVHKVHIYNTAIPKLLSN